MHPRYLQHDAQLRGGLFDTQPPAAWSRPHRPLVAAGHCEKPSLSNPDASCQRVFNICTVRAT